MNLLVDEHAAEVAQICAEFNVRRLELFGSGSNQETFDPERSDLDFIVEFAPNQPLGPWLSHFTSLKQRLEELFDRPVDLVLHSALRPGTFLDNANRSRAVLYAA